MIWRILILGLFNDKFSNYKASKAWVIIKWWTDKCVQVVVAYFKAKFLHLLERREENQSPGQTHNLNNMEECKPVNVMFSEIIWIKAILLHSTHKLWLLSPFEKGQYICKECTVYFNLSHINKIYLSISLLFQIHRKLYKARTQHKHY